MTHSPLLQARVRTLRTEAQGVLSIELVPQDGQHFPAFTAGSHVDLHLPNGITRCYSLLNSTQERDRYVLGVLSDPKSRGGSRYVHENLRCAAVVPISTPRNNFALADDVGESESVLIAGGIGITPILCMYRQLHEQGRPVRMVYCARSRKQAAFLEELDAIGGGITLWFDDEHDGAPFDLVRYLGGLSKDIHAYCCGPRAMLDAFEAACAASMIAHVHIERFAAEVAQQPASSDGYVVYLKRRDKTIDVPGGSRLLDALLDAGVDCDYSCREGICGACETSVLEGTVEHRDCVLTESDKAAGKSMMICVSGSKSGGRLVLDL
jgi:ferredoxin-NADP reductase